MLLVHQTIARFFHRHFKLMKKKNLSAQNFKLKYLMLTFQQQKETWNEALKMKMGKKSHLWIAL